MIFSIFPWTLGIWGFIEKCQKSWSFSKIWRNKGTFQKRFSGFCPLRGYPLADCPAVSLDLCIYTAGGKNPLYQGELLKQCSNVKNKAIGLIFFAELESYMHKVDVEANKWRKNWWKPTEKYPKSAGHFLVGFHHFFCHLFAFKSALCMQDSNSAKKISPIALFLTLEHCFKSSSRYRGFPPPAV